MHADALTLSSEMPMSVLTACAQIDKAKLIQGTRVALDMTTLTIMRNLPREVLKPTRDTCCKWSCEVPPSCAPVNATGPCTCVQVDPTVYHMLNEDPGDVSYSSVGGVPPTAFASMAY